MNFLTQSQQDCYQKVAGWLPEICDRVSIPIADKPMFSVQIGSATVLVEIRHTETLGEIIYIWAYVATEVEIRPDLLRFLLRQNYDFRFGGFSMADEGDIRFHVTLLGNNCDANEFKLALTEVLESADHFDDQIVERWGGRRATDTLFN